MTGWAVILVSKENGWMTVGGRLDLQGANGFTVMVSGLQVQSSKVEWHSLADP